MARRQVRPRFWGFSFVALMLAIGCILLAYRNPTSRGSLLAPINRPAKAGRAPQWTATTMALPMPLQGLSAGAAGDVVYVAGGINTQSHAGVWALRGQQFVHIGSLPDPVHDAALVIAGPHLLMVGGGTFRSTDTIQEMDLGTPYQTHILPPLPIARSDLGAVWWHNAAYLVGGHGNGVPSNLVWRYTVGRGAVIFTRMPLGVRYAACARWRTTLYVVGGLTTNGPTRQAVQINLKTGQLQRLMPYPMALQYAEAFTLNGTLWVAGGRTSKGWTRVTYFWDGSGQRWMKGPNLPEPAGYGAVVSLTGHQELWIGGRTTGRSLNVVWRFTP